MASGHYSMTVDLQTNRQSTFDIRRNSSQLITNRVEKAIINAVETTEVFLDIISALHKLKNTLLSHEMYPQLLQNLSAVNISTKEKILCFIYGLLEFIPFSSLKHILESVGFESLATRISNNINGNACRKIGRAEYTSSTKLQRYFYRKKSLLDDNVFHCRESYLQTLFNELVLEMVNSEDSNAQMTVGKFAIVTWLRVQLYEQAGEKQKLLDEMVNKLPRWADKTLPDIVYESKSAIICELNGDSDAAEIHLRDARTLTEMYSDPLFKALVFHDARYVHQVRFMKHKDNVNQNAVRDDCIQAIHFFSTFQNDLCIYMKRMLYLYLLHNLLKVGQNFEVDDSEAASPGEVAQANDIFSCLERSFQSGLPLENRRKMIYFILRSRMHEIGGGVDFAVSYLDQACSLKDDGTYFQTEEEHLTHFKSRLNS